ncbi:hypothetical protein LXL04_037641 [Taraxacum kok-saghyz]
MHGIGIGFMRCERMIFVGDRIVCMRVEAAWRETAERGRQRWRNGFLSDWSECWRNIEEVTDLDAGKCTGLKGESEEKAVKKHPEGTSEFDGSRWKRRWVGSLFGLDMGRIRVSANIALFGDEVGDHSTVVTAHHVFSKGRALLELGNAYEWDRSIPERGSWQKLRKTKKWEKSRTTDNRQQKKNEKRERISARTAADGRKRFAQQRLDAVSKIITLKLKQNHPQSGNREVTAEMKTGHVDGKAEIKKNKT